MSPQRWKTALPNSRLFYSDQVFPILPEDLLHLLPSKVYGFDLAKKQWTGFIVEDLKRVVFDETAWDHLVLDPDIKVHDFFLHDIFSRSDDRATHTAIDAYKRTRQGYQERQLVFKDSH